jgi:hypothetical protein
MTEPKTETKTEVAFNNLVAGVEVLTSMRSSGEVTVAVTRLRGLRVIVDIEAFREKLSAKLTREVSQDEAYRVRREIAHLALASAVADVPQHQYEAYVLLSGRPSKAKEPGEEFLKSLKYVADNFLTQSLRDRIRRIEEALSPVLEDVSVELITKREEPNANDLGGVPYLRLTYHVSVPDPASGFLLFSGPHVFFGPSKGSSFSMECDEHDLDLMIRRIHKARDMLAKAAPKEVKGGA